MQTLRQDIAYALRQMRLSPVFTLTAMLTLALGIGASTAIFAVLDAVLLDPLPFLDRHLRQRAIDVASIPSAIRASCCSFTSSLSLAGAESTACHSLVASSVFPIAL